MPVGEISGTKPPAPPPPPRIATEQAVGMKLCEFKPCSACNRPLGSEGAITFYRVSLEHFVVMVDAVRRQYGLELMLGSPALAATMGPDEDLAKRATHAPGILVCQDCAVRVTLAELMEGSAPPAGAPASHG